MRNRNLTRTFLVLSALVLTLAAGCNLVVPQSIKIEDVPVYPGAVSSRPFDYPLVGAVEDSIVGATKTASQTQSLSNVAPNQVQIFYDEKMVQSGWKQKLASALPSGSAIELVYERGQQLVLIMYFTDGKNNGYLITDLYQISK